MHGGVGNMIKAAFTTVFYIFQQQHGKKTNQGGNTEQGKD